MLGFLRLRCLSTHLSIVKTESVDGRRRSAAVFTIDDDVTRNVAAIPFKAYEKITLAQTFIDTDLHRIFVSAVVSGVNNSNSLAPVDAERGPQDVDGRSTFVPLHRRLGLDGAVSLASLETRFLDQTSGFFGELGSQMYWSFAEMEGQKSALVLYPSAVSTHSLLQLAQQLAHLVVELGGHGMDEFGTVRVQNFQTVISGVGYALYSNHLLDIVHIPAGNDRDVYVGYVGKSLEDVLGFWGNYGQIWVRSDGRQSTVVVQQQRQFVCVSNVPKTSVD
jgi:hypothetical protein